MKDYKFMISDDRFHKQDIVKKKGGGGAKQNVPHKEEGGVVGKRGGRT